MTARRLSGDTTSAMLVHSLAISVVHAQQLDPTTIRLRRPNGAMADVDQAVIRFSDLQAVVGNALAASTLKGIVSRHHSLHRDGDRLTVDLTSRQVV